MKLDSEVRYWLTSPGKIKIKIITTPGSLGLIFYLGKKKHENKFFLKWIILHCNMQHSEHEILRCHGYSVGVLLLVISDLYTCMFHSIRTEEHLSKYTRNLFRGIYGLKWGRIVFISLVVMKYKQNVTSPSK